MKKLYIITVLGLFFTLVSCENEVNYKPVGKFKFRVVNDSLFRNNSYLSPDSYGYAIGNLDFKDCGIEVLGIEKLNYDDDYIISMRPIESVSSDSQKVRGEGQDHLSKKPLDVRLKDTVTTDIIYIYSLQPKDKYRLLLP